MSNDDKRDTMVERDHPQTRKGEPDARGSAEWNEDVVPADGDDKHRPDDKSD